MKDRITTIISSPTLLLGMGIVIRLLWIFGIEVDQSSDALWYHTAAQVIAEQGQYTWEAQPTAFFPVGYSAFLAAFYALFGASPFVGQLANVMLSAFLLFFGYDLARRWFSDKIAWWTLFVLAFYPNYIAYCSLLLNELLFTTLVLAGFWLLEQAKEAKSAWWVGLCWAFACHIKPWLIAFPFALKVGGRHSSWSSVFKIYLVIILLTLPWAYRNVQLLGSWVPFSTNGGINLWIGNNPHASGTYQFEGEVAKALDSTATEVQRGQQAFQLAIDHVSEHPLASLKLIPQKWYYLFHHGNEGFYWLKMGKAEIPPALWRWGSLFAQASYLIIVILAFIFLLTQLVKGKNTSFQLSKSLLLCGLLLFIYSIFFGYSRYHFPMIPFLIMYACAALFRRK